MLVLMKWLLRTKKNRYIWGVIRPHAIELDLGARATRPQEYAGSMQLRLTWERGRPARKNMAGVRLAQHEIESCKLAA